LPQVLGKVRQFALLGGGQAATALRLELPGDRQN
jgi:hypothetical protein